MVPLELVTAAARAATFAPLGSARPCGQRAHLLGSDDLAAHDDGRLLAVDDHVEVVQLCAGLPRAAAAVIEEGRQHRLAVHARVVDPPWQFNAGQRSGRAALGRNPWRCRWVQYGGGAISPRVNLGVLAAHGLAAHSQGKAKGKAKGSGKA